MKKYAPIMHRNTIERKSVRRSAKTIGADLLTGVPVSSFTRKDFRTSPILPGVTLITNEERNIRKLLPRGNLI